MVSLGCGEIHRGLPYGGWSLSYKGGDAMNYVTYSDLIQIGILIVAVIALFIRRK